MALIMDLCPKMCVCFSLLSFPRLFWFVFFSYSSGFKARQEYRGQLSSLTASRTQILFSPVILQETQWLLVFKTVARGRCKPCNDTESCVLRSLSISRSHCDLFLTVQQYKSHPFCLRLYRTIL